MSAARRFVLGMVFAAGLSGFSAAVADSTGNSDELLRQHCSNCHPLETVLSQPRTADEWTEIIYRMIDHGLIAPPEELEAIRDYLANHDDKAKSPPGGH